MPKEMDTSRIEIREKKILVKPAVLKPLRSLVPTDFDLYPEVGWLELGLPNESRGSGMAMVKPTSVEGVRPPNADVSPGMQKLRTARSARNLSIREIGVL